MAALFGYGAIELGLAIGYVFALWSGWQLRWKLCFGVLAGLNALLGIYYLSGSFFLRAPFSRGPLDYLICWMLPIASGGFIIVGIWIVIVSIVDVRGGKRLDWLHWLGVVGYLAPSCLELAWLIAQWIMGWH